MNIPSWRHEEICEKYWSSFIKEPLNNTSAAYSMNNMVLDIKRKRSLLVHADDLATMRGMFTAWRRRI